MADAFVGGVAGDIVSRLSSAIIDVMKRTHHFKSHLSQIQDTITRIKPIFMEMDKLNQKLGGNRMKESELFIQELKNAEEFIIECASIRGRSIVKRVRAMYKLDDIDESLRRFLQIYISLQKSRDMKEGLVKWNNHQHKCRDTRGSSSGTGSGVPLLQSTVIGFEDRVRDIKTMLLKDLSSSVVVVNGGGGCGKTTLATMLCHDQEIQGIFGNNIYFATISKTPNLKEVFSMLLSNKQSGHRKINFDSDQDAIDHWGKFINANKKSPILLVLDDIWHESIIEDLQFESTHGYKILVTSEMNFITCNTYKMAPLKDQDAVDLLSYTALSQGARQSAHNDDEIPYELVEKLAKSCKKNPLALSVVGARLKGTQVESWHHVLKKLSQAPESLSDLNLDEADRFQLARGLGLLKDKDHNPSTSSSMTRSPRIT